MANNGQTSLPVIDVVTPTPGIPWSPYQHAIFGDVAREPGHLVVQARAGSAKTTTLLEAMRFVPRGSRCVFLAFGVAIKNELKDRAPRGVDVMTLHALGFRSIKSAWGYHITVDERVARYHAQIALEDLAKSAEEGQLGEPRTIRFSRLEISQVAKLAALAKGALVSKDGPLAELAYAHECEPGSLEPSIFFEAVRDCLRMAMAPSPFVSYDDMVFTSVAKELVRGKYDVVFVDEMQDLSYAQLRLVKMAIRNGGKIIGAGDTFQAIYGWRGAHADAMASMTADLEARELPLTVTYRCPRSVVRVAKEYVPDIEAAPDAPEGVVREATVEQMLREVLPGDFVISRTNAVLTKLCLAALSRGIRSYIQGRKVGEGLVAFVERSGCDTITQLMAWLEDYRRRETERLMAADREDAIDALVDRIEVVVALSRGLRRTSELTERMDKLFSDVEKDGSVVFTSAHRSKGLESCRVWLIRETFLPKRAARSPARWQEEQNLMYVAVTRTKRELMMVHTDRADEDRG